MKAIAPLNSFTAIVGGALMVAGCAPKIDYETPRRVAASCVTAPPPTGDEIRRLPTKSLYEWYQLSRRASQRAANAKTLGYDIDPCIEALAMKEVELEHELQFR